MDRLFDDSEVRRADIQQLARIAATYPNQERFLTELTLDPPEATSDESGAPLLDEDYLILSTIHSAKGKEWSAVSILNVVDGCLPSGSCLATGGDGDGSAACSTTAAAARQGPSGADRAATRNLAARRRGAGDRHVYANRTRFIPNRLVGRFEQRTWLQITLAPSGEGFDGNQRRIDLAARMRGMWK